MTSNSSLTSECYGSTAKNPPFQLPTCPIPLVPKPLSFNPPTHSGKDAPLYYCIEKLECCLPCPAFSSFYPSNSFNLLIKGLTPLRIITTLLSLYIVISYSILPQRRQYPRILVLFLGLCVFFWQFASFMAGVLGDSRKLLCAYGGPTLASSLAQLPSRPSYPGVGSIFGSNSTSSIGAGLGSVVVATQETNLGCTIQGSVLLYFTMSILLWTFAIMLNLHLQIVWDSTVLKSYQIALHAFCWGIPIIFVSAAINENAIRYTHMSFCFLSPLYGAVLFFYPATGIIVLCVAVHLCTSIWLFLMTRKSKDGTTKVTTMSTYIPPRISSPAPPYSSSASIRTSNSTREPHNISSGYSSSSPSSPTPVLNPRVRQLSLATVDPRVPSDNMFSSSSSLDTSPPPLSSISFNFQFNASHIPQLSPRSPTESSNMKIVGIFSVQWRILMMALMILGFFIAIWSFYSRDILPLTSIQKYPLTLLENNAFEKWITCLSQSQNDPDPQSTCANAISNLSPSFITLVFIETFQSFGGLALFLVFGINSVLLKEWRDWIVAFRK